MRRPFPRFLPLVACLAFASVFTSLAAAPPVFAHAAFLGADPAAGTRLQTSPSQVTLTFTEPLNDRLSRAELLSTDGKAVPISTQSSAKRLILEPERELPRGAYRVRWHTVSTEDGHALEGTFSFGVRAAAAGGDHVIEQSPFARAGWIRISLRGLFYAASLLFVGGLVLQALLSRRGSWLAPRDADEIDAGSLERREQNVIVDIGWAAAGLAAAVALAEAADAAGGLSVTGIRDFVAGSVAGMARAVTVALLAAAALVAVRWPRTAAALAVAAFGAVAASGHAASATPRTVSILNDLVHLVSAAVWLGGIALVLIVWAPALRRQRRAARQALASTVLPSFGRVALPAFIVVSVTGLVSLLTQLGQLSALWETGYGRVLAVKIALVGLIAVVSYTHAMRLRPRLTGAAGSDSGAARRHWRLLRAESALSVAVVAAVAVLVAFPLPPRQLGEAQEAVAAAPVCDPCPLPEPASEELAVAENAGANVVAGWLRRTGEKVTGTIRVRDLRGEPSGAPVTVLASRQRSCGQGCVEFAGATGDRVQVAVGDGDSRHVAELPARWEQSANKRAKAIVAQVEAAMRSLDSVRQSETVSSGPGSIARTEYRLRAPDRMAFRTDNGIETIRIGKRQWFQAPGRPWRRTGAGQGLAFSTERWFRWTPYSQHSRLLREYRAGGRRMADIALFEPGTPLWLRMTVDTATGRVLRERSISKSHFTEQRYHSFNAPQEIDAPQTD